MSAAVAGVVAAALAMAMPMSVTLRRAGTVGCLVGGGRSATDDPSRQVRDARVEAALQAYDAHDFETAAAHFEAAYDAAHRAEDLFNAGRVYEEAGHPERARGYYERFVAMPGVPAEQREETQRRIDALPPVTAPAAPQVDKDASAPMRRGARVDRRHKVHWATGVGIGLMPAGAAALATGGALAVVAMKNAKNAQASTTPERPLEDTRQQRLAERQARTADVLLIAGSVVLATGVVFLLSGLEHRRRARRKHSTRRSRLRARGPGLSFSF